MKEMKPRERVFTALKRGTPDRIPWMENDIEEGLQERIMGTTDFTPGELCAKVGMDGFGYHFPMGGKVTAGQAMQAAAGFKESYYYPQKVTFDFVPPWIAEMGVTETGRTFVKRGLLTSNESLKLFDEYLPDRTILRAMKKCRSGLLNIRGIMRFLRGSAWDRPPCWKA